MEGLDDGAPPLAVVAANYGALPTDVLYDVLLRLPAKELCRLRLVCQSWRSLTSDPLFARAHSSRHPPYAVFLRHWSREVHVIDLHGSVIKRIPIRIGQRNWEALSTHGDLACISHGWGLAYIHNLATGAAVADIDAEHRRKVNAGRPVCLLGHVLSTGEYKVLRVKNGCDYSYSGGRRPTSPQTCEVMTLGSDGRSRSRWRKGRRPPVIVSCSPVFSWRMAVVAGVAYFLTSPEEVAEQLDSVAVFDMATEVWKPTTIQGPLSSTDEKLKLAMMHPIGREQFQLARLGERLVTLYCNIRDCLTELWFLVDMDGSIWTKQYTLQGTAFGNEPILHYHYPLAVLDDGRVVVWVERKGELRAYDPRTSTWTDLATLSGDVVMHHGSLLCPNLGGESCLSLCNFEQVSETP
ncbi:unnamed protein product [Urochloa decumbens]|uniref:F-box domain-containing protein n=1 Tax=Urochloa decumbens TaxID=240449 RepID=A0ABC8VW09_9POAL